jgi:hypothetical protein
MIKLLVREPGDDFTFSFTFTHQLPREMEANQILSAYPLFGRVSTREGTAWLHFQNRADPKREYLQRLEILMWWL